MRFPDIKGHLSRFRVGIAGAGGLGSNCAASLVRSGIGELVIADFDIIEEANLNRQFYFKNQVGRVKVEALKENLLQIGSGTIITIHNINLCRENVRSIFSDCDVIVEAFDRAEMKEMLLETVQTEMKGVPIIIGSGMAGWGSSETIQCRKIDDSLYVCGDESSEISEENPPMAPRVGIVANMQANVVIQILMNKK